MVSGTQCPMMFTIDYLKLGLKTFTSDDLSGFFCWLLSILKLPLPILTDLALKVTINEFKPGLEAFA